MLTPKQILQQLSINFAKVKTTNISRNLLNNYIFFALSQKDY